MKLPKIPGTTLLGSMTVATGIVTVLFEVLKSNWPWWAHQPATVTGAVATLITPAIGYLVGWLRIVLTPGQQVMVRLTPSPFPTVQSAPVPRGEGPS